LGDEISSEKNCVTNFLLKKMSASSCSPKDFYALCTQMDPSRAIQILNDIPLSSRGPFVSFRNKEGEEKYHKQTPLHAAAGAGHLELVQLLIDSKKRN